MQKSKLTGIYAVALFLSAFFGGLAWNTMDAMMMGMRFQNKWWISVDFWEFSPQVKPNWWVSWVISALIFGLSFGVFFLSVYCLASSARTTQKKKAASEVERD